MDKEFDVLIENLLFHPHIGGKHLHKTEHEVNQTATETEDDKSETEQPHDPYAGSIYNTSKGSTSSSKSKEYLEPDNVVAVEPKVLGKKRCKCKTTKTPTPKNTSKTSEGPVSNKIRKNKE